MGDLRRLPFVDGNPEAIKKAYDTITFQAVSSGETLTVTIKNTGKKNIKIHHVLFLLKEEDTPQKQNPFPLLSHESKIFTGGKT